MNIKHLFLGGIVFHNQGAKSLIYLLEYAKLFLNSGDLNFISRELQYRFGYLLCI